MIQQFYIYESKNACVKSECFPQDKGLGSGLGQNFAEMGFGFLQVRFKTLREK